MATRVLVVEDEAPIQELLRYTLVQEGFEIDITGSIEAAQRSIAERLPDIILLDLMLPGASGTTLAKELRRNERTRTLPIIMVTARADELDRISGLETGADDYVTKPFSPRELVARIRTILRRVAPEHSGAAVETGGVRIDPVSCEARFQGVLLELGPIEFRLLHYLMTHPNRVFSREQLLNAVWGDHRFVEERTVDVNIRRLRAALGEQGERLIDTVRGFGYKFVPPETAGT